MLRRIQFDSRLCVFSLSLAANCIQEIASIELHFRIDPTHLLVLVKSNVHKLLLGRWKELANFKYWFDSV